MKTRPILFNGEMVRAIDEERKSVTRRVMKPQPFGPLSYYLERCPYGKPGDILVVKETHWRWGHWEKKGGKTKAGKPRWGFVADDSRPVLFAPPTPADVPADRAHLGYQKRPSIFMPFALARTRLEVTEVSVEMVQAIGEEDARAEGVIEPECSTCGYTRRDCRLHGDHHLCEESDPGSSRSEFIDLWNSINKARGFGWAVNPFVWVVSFKRVTS